MKHIRNIQPSFILKKESLESKEIENKPFTLADIVEEENKTPITSKFNFLKASGGYQRGHIHVLLGRTNKGKSTLIQSLVTETILKGNRCLLYVSEGLKHEIRTSIEEILSLKLNEGTDEVLQLVAFANDQSPSLRDQYNPEIWVNSLFNLASKSKSDIVFIDNFSTSPFGDASPEIQARFIRRIKEKSQSTNLPVFGAVHPTKSASTIKKLELQDIRANSAFCNIPSFIYAFNDVPQKGGTRILEIIKARKNGEITGAYYELFYKSLNSEGYYHKDVLLPNATAERQLRVNSWHKPTARN